MAFNRVAILGVGLMGGSVGLACKQCLRDVQIIGYGNKPDELAKAQERGAVDLVASDPQMAVRDADVVVLCTPVGAFGQLMPIIGPVLKNGAIVTDVGSTKRFIVQLAEQRLPNGVHFVGSHPMVGGEKHGIDRARADLLTNGVCIITPSPSTDSDVVKQVDHFWKTLGMRTLQMSPETHDQLTADISHLPHAVAAAIVRIQSAEGLKIAGRGFLDITRIAASDPALWRDILLQNRDNLTAGLLRLQAEIQELIRRLDASDAAEVEAWLDRSTQLRKTVE